MRACQFGFILAETDARFLLFPGNVVASPHSGCSLRGNDGQGNAPSRPNPGIQQPVPPVSQPRVARIPPELQANVGGQQGRDENSDPEDVRKGGRDVSIQPTAAGAAGAIRPGFRFRPGVPAILLLSPARRNADGGANLSQQFNRFARPLSIPAPRPSQVKGKASGQETA